MSDRAGPLPALEVDGLTVAYETAVAVRSVSLAVPERTMLALLGPNGAGKTSLLSAVAGLLPARAGEVRLRGRRVSGLPAHGVPRAGIRLVPENRALFPDMSVAESLAVGLGPARDPGRSARLDRVHALFPVLGQRSKQVAGTLSGGEQQMLSIARALVGDPAVLVLDEPSMGLAPRVVLSILDAVAGLRDGGLTVVVAEQNARAVLRVADAAVVLARGQVLARGTAAEVGALVESEGYLGSAPSSP